MGKLPMIEKIEEVCAVCYKFLNTVYDRRKMKNVKIISTEEALAGNENYQCKSIYHKKLTDRSRSSH
jgi:hypothetical protein